MAASETNAKEFTIARTLNAPRELVWKAWTEREALEEWWGPKGCPIEVEELDVKPGGKFHYSMRMPDGSVWWGVFHYREVESPHGLSSSIRFPTKTAKSPARHLVARGRRRSTMS